MLKGKAQDKIIFKCMSNPIFSKVLTEPIFKEGLGTLGESERYLLDEAVAAFRRDRVVEFREYVHRNQWNYFIEKTKGIEGVIKLFGPLPNDWITDDKKKIEVFNEVVYKNTINLLAKRGQYPFQYKRDAKNLDKDFLMTYANSAGKHPEIERERMTQLLERLNVLDNSVYSRPGFDVHLDQKQIDIDYIFPIQNQNVTYKNIENSKEHFDQKYYYDQKKMLPALSELGKRVNCYAVLDVFPFNNEINGTPSEKFLWPVFLGIPFIYIGSRMQIDVLRSWGFEPNDPYRYNYRETAEQMLWLKSIFQDPDLAQKWQGAQGELACKNWEALKKLPDRLI